MSILQKCKDFFLDKTLQENISLLNNESNKNDFDYDSIIQTNLLSLVSFIKDKSVNIGTDVYNDIEFFSNYTNNSSAKTLFDTFDELQLHGSKLMAKNILSEPLFDSNNILERKGILQRFEDKYVKDAPMFKELFTILQDYEKDALWLFINHEQHIEDLFNIVYFRVHYMKHLNNSPLTLTCYNIYRILVSPLIGIFSPIIYFIIPYLVIIWKFKIPISFTNYIKFLYSSAFASSDLLFIPGFKGIQKLSYLFSLIFYFQGMLNSIEVSRTLYRLSKFIVNKFNNVVKYIKTAKELIQTFWDDASLEHFIHSSNINSNENDFEYIDSLIDKEFSLFSLNSGKHLCTYKNLKEHILKSVLIKTYLLDFIKSCICFKNKHDFCYTNIQKSTSIKLDIKGLRHPCLDIQKVVNNDFKYNSKNIIITGPNAGGKSTFVKSLLINVLLSQILCISTCDSCILTPFKNINSQINIPDNKGYESLFEAEMHRCHKNLELLKTNDDNTIIFMDEIFNSTNPVEGISAAYAIAKKISEYSNCLLIFTTHYVYLTKLAKNTDKFINYRMNVLIDGSTDIKFPYKLSNGISKQYIALELLRKNGFDENIVNEAIEIKKKLTS